MGLFIVINFLGDGYQVFLIIGNTFQCFSCICIFFVNIVNALLRCVYGALEAVVLIQICLGSGINILLNHLIYCFYGIRIPAIILCIQAVFRIGLIILAFSGAYLSLKPQKLHRIRAGRI